MLKAFVQKSPFGYWEKRFAAQPRLRDALLPTFYLNSPDVGSRLGFVRSPVSTILIDLSLSEAELLKACRSNTRYEIQRAMREGAQFAVNCDHQRFLSFYTDAARNRPLPATSDGYLRSLGDNACITEGLVGGQLIVTHLYVVDRSSARARLIRSASMFRELHRDGQSKIGRVNRFLHYQDMLHFKDEGLRWYDLGGYYPPEVETTEDMKRISEFKSGFGGERVQEANYLSIAQYVYRRLHTFIK